MKASFVVSNYCTADRKVVHLKPSLCFYTVFFSLHESLCHIVFYSGQLYDFVLKDILLGVAQQWTKRTL